MGSAISTSNFIYLEGEKKLSRSAQIFEMWIAKRYAVNQ